MGRFWRRSGNDLQKHLDLHEQPQASQRSIVIPLGDLSADFDLHLYAPDEDGFIIRRVYLTLDAAVAADSAAFWTIQVYANDASDRRTVLIETNGARDGFTAKVPLRQPLTGNVDQALRTDMPLRIRGSKTASPSSLSKLVVQLVLALP